MFLLKTKKKLSLNYPQYPLLSGALDRKSTTACFENMFKLCNHIIQPPIFSILLPLVDENDLCLASAVENKRAAINIATPWLNLY